MIKEAIQSLVSGDSLTMAEAARVMEEIMAGEATPAQFGAFVTALRLKGETVDEIAGLARTMRARAIPVAVSGPVVDTCGTGGDGSGTFNISTTAAFVAAGAGLKVAKHGNRAMTSKCGSADVLEALGVRLDLTPEQVATCIEKAGIGFIFAPAFHPAMKFATVPRREIGIRTVFNVLGPLTNPAGASAQVLGVADGAMLEKMALVLRSLGSRHAVIVHGEDGLDEVTLTGSTHVCEMKDGAITSYTIKPEDFGFSRVDIAALRGGSTTENAAILRAVLSGLPGPQRNAVLMNASAALVAGGLAAGFADGVDLARKAIDSGNALARLEHLIAFCGSIR